MEDRIQRMKELVSILREAGKAYYQERAILNMTSCMTSWYPWKRRPGSPCQEVHRSRWGMRY